MDVKKLSEWLTAYCRAKDAQTKSKLRSDLVAGGVTAESHFVLLEVFRNQDEDMMKVLTEEVWSGEGFNVQTMMCVLGDAELCRLIKEFRDQLRQTHGQRL